MVRPTSSQTKYIQSLIAHSISMRQLTSLRCGGDAELYSEPHTIEDLLLLLEYSRERSIPCTVIGCGTNLLAESSGTAGLIISTRSLRKVEYGHRELIAEAGVPVDAVVEAAVANGWKGVERLFGLPGSIGGAVFGNAGCFGTEIADCISWVEYVDDRFNRVVRGFDSHDYSYRDSVFKKRNLLITRVCLSFGSTDSPDLLRMEAQRCYDLRREKGHYRFPSAGSVFRKPVNGVPSGDSLIFSSGELIEQCGLKGKSCGGAVIADYHANFIINPGELATSRDVLQLIGLAQNRVKERFGIEILCEIRYVGTISSAQSVSFGVSPDSLAEPERRYHG